MKKSELGLFGKFFLELIGDCFTDDIMKIQPNDNQIHKFREYFLSRYVTPRSLVPPSLSAEFTSSPICT